MCGGVAKGEVVAVAMVQRAQGRRSTPATESAPTSAPRWLVEMDGAEAGCAQPAQVTASASGTESATAALCPETAIGWPPWMVAVVGTVRRRGAGAEAGVEPARLGPALEALVESVHSTVAPRAKPWTTPPNAVTEGRRLHVGVPRNDVVQENAWGSCQDHGVRPESDSREPLQGVPGCPPVVPPEGGCCRSVCPMSGHGSSPSRRF